ncbi:MAG: endonuclease III [Thermoproteota archaeon]|nr:endonuclease III [Thermoproteota archaeon]
MRDAAKYRASKVLSILKNNFSLPTWTSSTREPFQTLIVTVISQNTADKNTAKAFENLSNRFQITPEALAKANQDEIEEAIRVAGLYRNKSQTIKRLSQIILEQFNGSLEFIHSVPLKKARKILLELPGVGPKTADVVLLFCAEKPTVPVDTHVNRVSKRLGFASSKTGYEEVRLALQSLYYPKDYLAVHLLLISLGRKYCKAGKPLCKSCPVNHLCPSKQVED